MLSAPLVCFPTDPYDDFASKAIKEYEDFKKKATADYEQFRSKANSDYEAFMRNPWAKFDRSAPVPAPPLPEPGPITNDDDDDAVAGKRPTLDDDTRPLPFTTVVIPPAPEPRPVPIVPIEEQDDDDPVAQTDATINFNYYGLDVAVRKPANLAIRIAKVNEKGIADAWKHLAVESISKTNNTILDCLAVRDNYGIPDWGYLTLLDRVSSEITDGEAEKILLMGYMLNQSGYDIRFGYNNQGNLVLLYASDGIVFNVGRYDLGGKWYYPYNPVETAIYVCNYQTPGEKVVSMMIPESPRLPYRAAEVREVTPKNYPDVTLRLAVNKNLIDFYNDYPLSAALDSPLSMWSIHANTPASNEVRTQLYPALKSAVEGMTQQEAVSFLLKTAQSFPYGYDDEIWGADRPFWMDESWYYPYSDCEDHSVNFSRMVRDILGLDVCLVVFSNHLATCVAFTDDNVAGEYVDYKGKRYVFCDPTFFYGGVGERPSNLDLSTAVLVPVVK